MGNGIAPVCASAGLKVAMIDVTEAAVGLATIRDSLERLVRKDRLAAAERDVIVGRIEGSTAYERLAGLDLVIEAATERKDLKIAMLKKVEGLVAKHGRSVTDPCPGSRHALFRRSRRNALAHGHEGRVRACTEVPGNRSLLCRPLNWCLAHSFLC